MTMNYDICCLFSLLFEIFCLNVFLSVLLRFQLLGVQEEQLASALISYVWHVRGLAPF